jgi:hypothetical protein
VTWTPRDVGLGPGGDLALPADAPERTGFNPVVGVLTVAAQLGHLLEHVVGTVITGTLQSERLEHRQAGRAPATRSGTQNHAHFRSATRGAPLCKVIVTIATGSGALLIGYEHFAALSIMQIRGSLPT